jgi:hypothetical protein
MSHTYRAVGWNAHKRAYDVVAASGALAMVAAVAGGTWWRFPQVTIETALIRGFGVAALILLHAALSIGSAGSIGAFCRCSTIAATSA